MQRGYCVKAWLSSFLAVEEGVGQRVGTSIPKYSDIAQHEGFGDQLRQDGVTVGLSFRCDLGAAIYSCRVIVASHAADICILQ